LSESATAKSPPEIPTKVVEDDTVKTPLPLFKYSIVKLVLLLSFPAKIISLSPSFSTSINPTELLPNWSKGVDKTSEKIPEPLFVYNFVNPTPLTLPVKPVIMTSLSLSLSISSKAKLPPLLFGNGLVVI